MKRHKHLGLIAGVVGIVMITGCDPLVGGGDSDSGSAHIKRIAP
ncbi:MAG: hypothetical protein ACOC47_06275 [Alkalispirochaetaceae bacterium]